MPRPIPPDATTYPDPAVPRNRPGTGRESAQDIYDFIKTLRNPEMLKMLVQQMGSATQATAAPVSTGTVSPEQRRMQMLREAERVKALRTRRPEYTAAQGEAIDPRALLTNLLAYPGDVLKSLPEMGQTINTLLYDLPKNPRLQLGKRAIEGLPAAVSKAQSLGMTGIADVAGQYLSESPAEALEWGMGGLPMKTPRALSKLKGVQKKALGDSQRELNLKRFKSESVVQEPVFHGSTAVFDEFKEGDIGFHFGTAEAANERLQDLGRHPRFSDSYPNQGNIGKFHIRLERPLEMHDVGDWDRDYIVHGALEDLVDNGDLQGPLPPLIPAPKYPTKSTDRDINNANLAQMQEWLKAQGHDGIIYRNMGEGTLYKYGSDSNGIYILNKKTGEKEYYNESGEPFWDTEEASEEVRNLGELEGDYSYIVFNANQIKSATGNRGTFSLKSDSPLKAIAVAGGGTAAYMANQND